MREKEQSTRIIYVRHGQTDFPVNRIYCDDVEDPALNAAGRDQVGRAASLLRHVNYDAIYASPSKRTLMTAEELAHGKGLEIYSNPLLRERRFGIWDGLYFQEIEQKYPEAYLSWKQDQAGYSPEGGETMYDVLERVNMVLESIIKDHKNQTVIVVSHVGPIRLCIADALGMPLSAYRQLTIDYASISAVDYGRSQNNLLCCTIGGRTFVPQHG